MKHKKSRKYKTNEMTKTKDYDDHDMHIPYENEIKDKEIVKSDSEIISVESPSNTNKYLAP